MAKTFEPDESDIDPQFRTESDYDYQDSLDELESYLTDWDRLIPPEERSTYTDVDLKITPHCPYMVIADDSEFFYFCELAAHEYEDQKLSVKAASKNSLEFKCRCNPQEFRDHCIGNSEDCRTRKELEGSQD